MTASAGDAQGDDSQHPEEAPAADAPTGERWEVLAQAFAAHRYPSENLALVQRLVDAIGIDHYEGIESRSYIKAVRRSPGRNLVMAYGYTGGLQSEQEILGAVGDVDRGSSPNGREWWMHHPVNKLRDGNGPGSGSGRRDHGICPSCFLALPASGVCDACGD